MMYVDLFPSIILVILQPRTGIHLEQGSAQGTAGRVGRVEPLVQTRRMEPVFASPAWLCRQRAIRQGDDTTEVWLSFHTKLCLAKLGLTCSKLHTRPHLQSAARHSS